LSGKRPSSGRTTETSCTRDGQHAGHDLFQGRESRFLQVNAALAALGLASPAEAVGKRFRLFTENAPPLTMKSRTEFGRPIIDKRNGDLGQGPRDLGFEHEVPSRPRGHRRHAGHLARYRAPPGCRQLKRREAARPPRGPKRLPGA
jgi:hypothetical protein